MKVVTPDYRLALDNYAAVDSLADTIAELRETASKLAPALRGGTVWHINSTARGGGVAELLPAHISLLCQLGIDMRWAVMQPGDPAFFPFTKRLHNLIHADECDLPTEEDRGLFERVSAQQADELEKLIRPSDVVIIHDPQPLAVGSMIRERMGVYVVWRCHIGVDVQNESTSAAWNFLRPYASQYERAVFSIEDYVPDYLRDRSAIIHPTIDPLSDKNRELSREEVIRILDGTGIVASNEVKSPAQRIITQVSRWDQLKGFAPLLEAFCKLNQEHTRLVLAGPDPTSVQDDPEAQLVFKDLTTRYRQLPADVQQKITIVSLPMDSQERNALMVNALQRASDIVVQNSLREGFGLTVSEAMWKSKPILGSARARGVRLQVRDGLEGRLVDDPEDTDEISRVAAEMLSDEDTLAQMGQRARTRVHDEFLIFEGIRRWLRLLEDYART